MCSSSLNKPSSQEGLKNCPFCGGEAERIDIDPMQEEFDNAGGSCIQCKACGASSSVHFGRKENLDASWNTRHPSFNDAIEAAAKAAEDQTWTLPLYPPEENINVAVGEAANIVLRQVAESIRSLKLPDYRGEMTSEKSLLR